MLVWKRGWRGEKGKEDMNPLKSGGLENLEVKYFLEAELF